MVIRAVQLFPAAHLNIFPFIPLIFLERQFPPRTRASHLLCKMMWDSTLPFTFYLYSQFDYPVIYFLFLDNPFLYFLFTCLMKKYKSRTFPSRSPTMQGRLTTDFLLLLRLRGKVNMWVYTFIYYISFLVDVWCEHLHENLFFWGWSLNVPQFTRDPQVFSKSHLTNGNMSY